MARAAREWADSDEFSRLLSEVSKISFDGVVQPIPTTDNAGTTSLLNSLDSLSEVMSLAIGAFSADSVSVAAGLDHVISSFSQVETSVTNTFEGLMERLG